MRILQMSIFGLLLFSLSMVACKKEETKTNTQLLASKSWRLTALTVDPPIVNPLTQTAITDAYAQLDACDKDDLTTFKETGVVIFDEGAAKCNTNDPQTSQSTWSFNSTESIITVDSEDWKLIELTDSKLKVSYTENSFGTVYTFTATFE